MPKAYLVMDRDYLYTDEYYAPWFEDGICTEPVQVLDRREDAEALARTLSRPRFRGLVLGDYALASHQTLSSLPLKEFYLRLAAALQDLSVIPGTERDLGTHWQTVTIPETLNDTQIDQVMDVLDGIQFFQVVESTTEDPQLLDQAKRVINAGVVDPEQQLYRAYRVPEEDIAQAVAPFGLEFEPFDGGL